MARFRGTVGNTSRLASDDLMATAYGWNIGGSVFVYRNDEPAPPGPRGGWRKGREVDNLTMSVDGGTNRSKHPQITVYANSDGHYCVFVNGECVATDTGSNDGMSEIGRGQTRTDATREAVARMVAK